MVGKTAYDLLAELCALLNKEEERRCAMQRVTAKESHIHQIMKTFHPFLKMIHNSLANEYIFNSSELLTINKQLEIIAKCESDVIFHLAVAVEQEIQEYSGWLGQNVFHSVPPLNGNFIETGIEVYPRVMPLWNLDKSERNRKQVLNTYFKNYMIVRTDMMFPFHLNFYYWKDKGLLKETGSGWNLSVALSPVMNYAELATEDEESENGYAVAVQGLKNKEIVTQRVLDIFDRLFPKQYSLIIFTEGLGTEELVTEVKKRMRSHPEYCTIVALPTICKDHKNRLIVLGPGGVDCLHHDKATPFILMGKDGIGRREQLQYDNRIPVLITQELGLVAFPICAEFLDPEYYRAMTEEAMVDTIICPSFSPGVQAFKDTMAKGTATISVQKRCAILTSIFLMTDISSAWKKYTVYVHK